MTLNDGRPSSEPCHEDDHQPRIVTIWLNQDGTCKGAAYGQHDEHTHCEECCEPCWLAYK